MTPLTVAGRTAVVTGAGSGIGAALALHAARAGMAVAACDRDVASLGRLADALGPVGARHLIRAVDVTDAAAMTGFADEVAETLPTVALLFANAGILRTGTLLGTPPADWRRLLDVNVVGTVVTVQAFAPAMRAASAASRIVVTGSTGSMLPAAGLSAYCATKHALWPMVEALTEELASTSVGVSLLMPGAVATHIFAASEPDRAPPADSITPEMAAAMAFEGAVAGRAKILTHPAYVERFRRRFESTLSDVTLG